MRRRAPQLIALGIGVVLSLAFAEIVLRIVRPAQLSRIEYPCIYEPDPELGFHYIPGSSGAVSGHFEIDNRVEINSLGFYDDEPLPPGASSLRVLAVGDSFTAAMNVPRGDVWTAVVERELRARGYSSADVVNLGIDGTGTDVHVREIERFLPRLRPQLVVLAFYGNDFLDVQNGRFTRECYEGYVLSYQSEAQRQALCARADALRGQWLRQFLFDHLFVARAIAYADGGVLNPWRLNYLQPRRTELGLDDATLASRHSWVTAAVDRLQRLARGCACQLLVAPVPARVELQGSLRIFQSEAAGRGFEVVDVVPPIRAALARDGRQPNDLFFVHDDHLNVYGNRLYGEAVAAAILRARSVGATTR
jgi:hypothetical protein